MSTQQYNHIGVFPYFYKFRDNIFSQPEYNSRSNWSKVYPMIREWASEQKRYLGMHPEYVMLIDGVEVPRTNKSDRSALESFGNYMNIRHSIMFVPPKYDLTKAWWLSRLVLYSRGLSKGEFTIIGESRLSQADMKKHHVVGNNFPYPTCIYSDGSDYRAMKFERDGEELNPAPHARVGHVCLGNYSDDVYRAIDSGQDISLMCAILEYSTRFNPDDGFGRVYTEFIEPLPRICSECGRRIAPREDIFVHDNRQYCNTCYHTGQCSFCPSQTTRAMRFKKVCDECASVLSITEEPTFTCSVCGDEIQDSNVKLYFYPDNSTKVICQRCNANIKFERRSPFPYYKRYTAKW